MSYYTVAYSTTHATYQDGYAGPFAQRSTAEQALLALIAAGSAVNNGEVKKHEGDIDETDD